MNQLELTREIDDEDDGYGNDVETTSRYVSGDTARVRYYWPRGTSLEETMRLRDHQIMIELGMALGGVERRVTDTTTMAGSLGILGIGLGAFALIKVLTK
jgi:hypothetical protein